MFIAFLSKIFIGTKMKSYGYKLLIMYSLLWFMTSSHLSTNLLMMFHQKSPGLVSKNLLSQFLRSSSLSKVTSLSYGWTKSGKDSNLWVQGLENTVDAKEPPI